MEYFKKKLCFIWICVHNHIIFVSAIGDEGKASSHPPHQHKTIKTFSKMSHVTPTKEMKVSDVRNWVMTNHPSEVWFTDMLWKKYSMGWTNRTLEGAWLYTWEVEKLFKFFLVDGENKFRAMQCEVVTYWKDSCPIEPSTF